MSVQTDYGMLYPNYALVPKKSDDFEKLKEQTLYFP